MTYLGITSGRIATAFIADRIPAKRMIQTSQLMIALAIIAMIPTRSIPLLYVIVFVLGFSFGPIYPTMLHQTPEYFGIEHSGRIMGLEMTSAYLSCALMPAFFGIIGRGISMLLFPFYVLLFLALNAAATETKARIRRI